MIAAWMVSVLLFSALVAAAARCGEVALRAIRRPTRWAWIAGMVVVATWPVVVPFARQLAPSAPEAAVVSGTAAAVAARPPVAEPMPDLWTRRLDTPLLVAWLVGSTFALARLAVALLAMRRMRRAGTRQLVDGVEVILSEDTGPSLIGVVRPAVMVPAFLMGLDEPLRRLVLRHEEEHRRSHDPLLILGAALAVALFPWNLALWWMARRVRLALEVDCDARVLATEPNPGLYGKLLLLISQRPVATTLAPMLAAHDSHLEQRISAMLPASARLRTRHFVLGAAATTILAAAACTARIADVSAPAPVDAVRSPDGGVAYFEFQVDHQVKTTGMGNVRYPDPLRFSNVSGEVLAQFIVDENGHYLDGSFKVLRSDHALFTEAVRAALPNMSFTPAELRGRRVRQVVQQPFTFALSTAAETKAPQQVMVAKRDAVTPSRIVAGARADSVAHREVPAAHADSLTAPADAHAARADSVPKPYLEFQLKHPATQIPGTGNMRYPDVLRKAGVEGEVLAQFVVMEDGTVMPGSLRILKSDDALFSESVRLALPNMRFNPARADDGHAIRQLMQQPFTFSLGKH